MMQWEIFSVSYSSNNLLKIDFDDVNDYSKYLNKLKTESLYDTNIELSSADRILTLSTCSDKFYKARLVIHAKLITEE